MPRGGSGFSGANAVPLGPRNPSIGAKRKFSAAPPPDRFFNPTIPSPMPEAIRPSPVGVSSKAAEALRAAQAAAASLQAKKFGDRPKVQTEQYGFHSAMPVAPAPPVANISVERGRPRKKRSRWGDVESITDIPGIPSSMPANLSNEQQKAYIVQLQIEDVTRKLKTGNLGIPPNPEDRSPSPEPMYNNEGKRLNTREYRTRKRLEEERHKLIQDMMAINENYNPPMDYRPPLQRISEQIVIPSELNPNVNFVGLLIGPRGNTLKRIEKECNCKIMIRGKGSVKEGKIGRKDGMPLPGEDEPLHALVTGTILEDVVKATKEINRIIKQGIEQPEGQNDLRKNQLMELARLNGTWREDTTPREREWLKPENQNITNTTICTKCGGRGHLAQDCISQAPSVGLQQEDNVENNMNQVDKAKMDSEYLSLMAELGQGAPPTPSGGNNSGGNNQQYGNRGGGQWGGRGGGGMRGGGSGGFGGQMGGNRQPWMRGGGGGGRGGNFGPRGGTGGSRGGFNNSNRGGGQAQNNFSTNSYGGYTSDYSANQGMGGGGNNTGWGMGGQYDNTMGYGGMDNTMMTPPPPPPPGNAPQPPPPPSSEDGSSGWNQNQWGNDGGQGGEQGDGSGSNQGGNNYSASESEQSESSQSRKVHCGPIAQNLVKLFHTELQSQLAISGHPQISGVTVAQDQPFSSQPFDIEGLVTQGGQNNMMGYGNMGWGTWGGNMGGGMGQPPMPPGPGPVAPPPPGGDDNSNNGNDQSGSANQQWSMGYNNMGYNMGFGMPPAPPPPPPSS